MMRGRGRRREDAAVYDSVARLVRPGHGLVKRLLELEIIDRSLVVGAQAFSALIPLFIVLASIGARGGPTSCSAGACRGGRSSPRPRCRPPG
jgi:hypothetical protein